MTDSWKHEEAGVAGKVEDVGICVALAWFCKDVEC